MGEDVVVGFKTSYKEIHLPVWIQIECETVIIRVEATFN